jgi:hypothetical protein
MSAGDSIERITRFGLHTTPLILPHVDVSDIHQLGARHFSSVCDLLRCMLFKISHSHPHYPGAPTQPGDRWQGTGLTDLMSKHLSSCSITNRLCYPVSNSNYRSCNEKVPPVPSFQLSYPSFYLTDLTEDPSKSP